MLWLTPGMARFQSSFHVLHKYLLEKKNWRWQRAAAPRPSKSLKVPPEAPAPLGTLMAVPQIPPWTHTMDRVKNKVRTWAGCVQQAWERARSSSSAVGVSAVEVATWPRVSTAHQPHCAASVAGALSQAHEDIARPRRILRIGTGALGTIRLQR